jgi:hypothetical protein
MMTALIGSQAAADDPLSSLVGMYEGVRTHVSGGRLSMVYGAPMTAGLSPDDAAARFWADHGQVFRGTQPQLTQAWSGTSREDARTIFAYTQTVRGVPVEGAVIRLTTQTLGGLPRVTFVSAKIAGEPLVGLEQPLIPAELAAAIVRSQQGYGELLVLGEPERVVLLADRERGDAWAWKVRTLVIGSRPEQPYTFYVDTATGRLLKVVSSRVGSGNEVAGMVTGKATPLAGNLPHISTNSPTTLALPRVRVGWSEAGVGLWDDFSTDTGGVFVFDVGSHVEVDVRAALGPTIDEAGPHFFIVNVNGSVTTNHNQISCTICWFDHPIWPAIIDAASVQEDDVSAPGSQSLAISDDDEYTVAQMNAVVHLERTRAYIMDRLETDENLFDDVLRIVVNFCKGDGRGSAFYHKHTNFPGCDNYKTLVFAASHESPGNWDYRNMAYSSVISHEYGHYVLDKLIGEPGLAFGEGFADTLSILVNADEQIGRWYEASVPFIRHPLAADCVYQVSSTGCSLSDPWERGQVLGGIWTRIMNNFVTTYPGDGLERARTLHVRWAATTTGADPLEDNESAHPGTLIEVLTADDDDGNLGNGTPNWSIICDAFEQHGIDCP